MGIVIGIIQPTLLLGFGDRHKIDLLDTTGHRISPMAALSERIIACRRRYVDVSNRLNRYVYTTLL